MCAFDEVDTDGSGAVGSVELKACLEKLAKENTSGGSVSLDDASVATLMSKMDPSGDGEVSLDEFVLFFRHTSVSVLQARALHVPFLCPVCVCV